MVDIRIATGLQMNGSCELVRSHLCLHGHGAAPSCSAAFKPWNACHIFQEENPVRDHENPMRDQMVRKPNFRLMVIMEGLIKCALCSFGKGHMGVTPVSLCSERKDVITSMQVANAGNIHIMDNGNPKRKSKPISKQDHASTMMRR